MQIQFVFHIWVLCSSSTYLHYSFSDSKVSEIDSKHVRKSWKLWNSCLHLFGCQIANLVYHPSCSKLRRLAWLWSVSIPFPWIEIPSTNRLSIIRIDSEIGEHLRSEVALGNFSFLNIYACYKSSVVSKPTASMIYFKVHFIHRCLTLFGLPCPCFRAAFIDR